MENLTHLAKMTGGSLTRKFLQGAPPRPCKDVAELLEKYEMNPGHILSMHQAFCVLLRRSHGMFSSDRKVPMSGLLGMITDSPKWTKRILQHLVELGGCFDKVRWDEFLYIFVQLASLTQLELYQTLFYVVVKAVKSDKLHYLTTKQIWQYLELYKKCPMPAFSISHLTPDDFPLTRYYITDFVELCKYHQCVGKPIVQLQRSIQKQIPSLEYWSDFDRVKTLTDRKIDLEFFLFKKTRVSLTNQRIYRDTCDMTLPQVMGDQRKPSLPAASSWRREHSTWIAKATQMTNEQIQEDIRMAEEAEHHRIFGDGTEPAHMAELQPEPGESPLSPKFLGKKIRHSFGEKKTMYMKSTPEADVPIPITLDTFEKDRKELPPFMRDLISIPEKASRSMLIPPDDVKRHINANGLNT